MYKIDDNSVFNAKSLPTKINNALDVEACVVGVHDP